MTQLGVGRAGETLVEVQVNHREPESIAENAETVYTVIVSPLSNG